MDFFEYKVIPAPTKGQKAKGVKRAPDRFALAIQNTLNAHAEDGWEFLRSETLPHEERSGLTGSSVTYRSILVLRRPIAAPLPEAASDTALPDDEENTAEDASVDPEDNDETENTAIAKLRSVRESLAKKSGDGADSV